MTRLAPALGLALLAACGAALAADDPALYPAAQCAAFWLGWDDYAAASSLMERFPPDLDLAEAWRQEALRLTTGAPEAIDAFIARQRGLMFRLIDEATYAPGVNRDLMERLTETCGARPVR